MANRLDGDLRELAVAPRTVATLLENSPDWDEDNLERALKDMLGKTPRIFSAYAWPLSRLPGRRAGRISRSMSSVAAGTGSQATLAAGVPACVPTVGVVSRRKGDAAGGLERALHR